MKVLMVFDNYSDKKVSGEFIAANINIEQIESSNTIVKIINTNEVISNNKFEILLNLFFSIKSFLFIRKEISNFNPDIVHFHNITPHLSPSVFLSAKLKKCKVFHTLHHSRWICIEGSFYRNERSCTDCIKNKFSGVRNKCVKDSLLASIFMTLNNFIWVKTGLIHKLVDRYIAVSSYTKKLHVQVDFPEEKISVLGHWKPYNSKNIPTLKERDIDLIFIGRVSTAKGINIIIDIAINTNYNVYICGTGRDEKKLQAIKHLNNVKILGMLDHSDIKKLLLRAKLLIMPSICSESFGLSAAEAVVHGTPVLVSNNGALPDIVLESNAGVVVSGDSYQDYLKVINELLSSSSKWNHLQQKALSFTGSLTSKVNKYPELLSLYESEL